LINALCKNANVLRLSELANTPNLKLYEEIIWGGGDMLAVDPFTVIPAIPVGEEFTHWSKRKIRKEILEAENWKLKMVSFLENKSVRE
jgi:hypothetical protein